jgi:L-alanine-DL-glutamate epimerase-like enolase superfamily enzyme
MKIAKFETFPLSIAYRHPEHSARVHRGGVSDVVVKLTADDGLIGWGESCSGADTASIVAALDAMAPFVLGRDPWQSEAIAREVFKTGLWDYRAMTGNYAFAGIDMALWDLCGKACGQPLYRLFGGAMRNEVDYFCYLAQAEPANVAAQCKEAVGLGYTCFYLKVGIDGHAEEAMLEALRATIGPERKIRIDANEAWSLPEAVHWLTRWNERFGIDFAEAPVKAFPLALMKELRQRVPVALCANEGLERQADVVRMIESGAVDVLCFSSYWVGSLRRFHTLSQMAHLYDLKVCKHTHGEFGIAAAAAHHIVLTLPNAIDGTQQTASILADDIVKGGLPIAHGPRWGLIEAPGLGIEIDEDKLRRHHESFRRDGQFLPYAA